MSDLPEDRRTAWVSGPTPGLSDEAERGRKELLWIAASVWIAPILSKVWDTGLPDTVGDIISIVVTGFINYYLFEALASGRRWARTLTLWLLVPASILSFVGGLVEGLGLIDLGRNVFSGLMNGAVFGVASFMLWRSPTILAYLEAQQDGASTVKFPEGRQPAALSPGAPNRLAAPEGSPAHGSTPHAIGIARSPVRDAEPRNR